MNLLIWLQDSALGTWVAGSIWGYPIVLSCHAVGMAVVAGTAVMLNLRVLGFARNVHVTLFDKLSFITWAGLALNVLTGLALFSGDPVKFFYHPVFWIKISLIILGVLSIWLVLREIRGTAPSPADRHEMPAGIKILAGFSLAFWSTAIVAGRLIAYIEHINGA
ncbi:MAG: hypothetical protein J4F40_19690 [Alphaproteobacteria bacterium]|nr:hypothetical protein [Alphaproteobacteria bacterium]